MQLVYSPQIRVGSLSVTLKERGVEFLRATCTPPLEVFSFASDHSPVTHHPTHVGQTFDDHIDPSFLSWPRFLSINGESFKELV